MFGIFTVEHCEETKKRLQGPYPVSRTTRLPLYLPYRPTPDTTGLVTGRSFVTEAHLRSRRTGMTVYGKDREEWRRVHYTLSPFVDRVY